MAHGLQVFDAAGQRIVDVSDRLARLHAIYSIPEIGAGSSYTVAVPGIVNDGTWFLFFSVNMIAMSINISGGNVIISNNDFTRPASTMTVYRG